MIYLSLYYPGVTLRYKMLRNNVNPCCDVKGSQNQADSAIFVTMIKKANCDCKFIVDVKTF